MYCINMLCKIGKKSVHTAFNTWEWIIGSEAAL